MHKKFIGFDLGAESGKCVVAELEDERVNLSEVHRFTTYNIKNENGFHWDISAIFSEIITGLKKAAENFGSEFAGIGIDTWAVDYVLIDRNGQMLGEPYHYRDNRTDNIMEQAFKVIPRNVIYKLTGIQFAQFNTLYQLLAENLERLSMADKFLLIPDYLNFLLSGKTMTEFTNASTTSLVDPYIRKWSDKLIDSFGLNRKIFPEIVEPGTILGNLLPSIAEETGLNSNIPVIASTSHDTASAVAAVPVIFKENWAYLSSGTWSLMGVELEQPLISPKAMKYNFTNEGGVENTTRFLKNIIGLWPVQECKRYWEKKSQDYSYSELVLKAEKNRYANSWIDLDDPRFLKPGEMPEKIINYLKESNQTFKDDIGFIIEVILESLAFSYRETFKQIEEVTGQKIKNLHVIGGGIQNELLTQFTSDATGCNVIAGPLEGTITGNIGTQAIAVGVVTDISKWRKIVSNSFELKTYTSKNIQYFSDNENNYKNIKKDIINEFKNV